MLREYIDISLSELTCVLSRISEEEVHTAVKAIARANRIVCAGSGRVGLGLRFFAMRLMHLGLDAHWAWDDTAPALGSGGLFVLGNGSGRENHAYHAALKAKEAGASVLVFTAVPKSPAGMLGDAVVRIPAPAFNAVDESLIPTAQPMGTLYEQTAVILYDAVTRLLMDALRVTPEEMRARHRNYE